MKKKILFWIIITLIAFFTRFYKLDLYPPSLSIDEVSIGYNAFSILKTGRDEWGNFLPSSFRSVGDYKAPTLIYLTVPFVKILGLNDFSTRLPVAIFSAINIFLFWLLVSRFIFNKKYSGLAYLSTFIFSISPWLIIFSRSSFEAVVALSFLLANLIFAFEFRKNGRIKDFIFMFTFAYLSAITYHSTKIVVPLINVIFILLDYKCFVGYLTDWYRESKIKLFITTIIFIGISIFFIKNFIFGPGSSRAGMTLLTNDFDYAKGIIPKLIAHPLFWLTSTISLISFWYKRFLEYFSANFYLSSGLGLSTPLWPGQGVIYAIEYPFLIVGFFILISLRKYFDSSISQKFVVSILVAWFFLGFLPASISNNSQHALRSLNVLPVIAILISLGIIFAVESVKKPIFKYILSAVIIAGYILGIIRFVDFYTLHYPIELSETRSYGWKQMAIYARDHHSEYDNVYVDPRFGSSGPFTFGTPYLYFLFYSQYDPSKYINDPRRKEGTNFENYIFTIDKNWPDINLTKNNLYIASPWNFPQWLLESKREKFFVQFINKKSGIYAISN